MQRVSDKILLHGNSDRHSTDELSDTQARFRGILGMVLDHNVRWYCGCDNRSSFSGFSVASIASVSSVPHDFHTHQFTLPAVHIPIVSSHKLQRTCNYGSRLMFRTGPGKELLCLESRKAFVLRGKAFPITYLYCPDYAIIGPRPFRWPDNFLELPRCVDAFTLDSSSPEGCE